MELLLLPKVTVAVALIGIVIRMCDALIFRPERLRSKLREQGIRGPPPAFLLGNIRDVKEAQSKVSKASREGEQVIISHNSSNTPFSFFEQWSKKYGSAFMFSLGNIQILHMNHPDAVKKISTCTSLDLGKPSYQVKERGPLLGQGILTSNGAIWAHQRKILAPEFYMENVKNFMSIMVESSNIVVDSWTQRIERKGGVVDINVDEDMRSFSGDVISKACFGSNYAKGEEIFIKLRALQGAMSKKALSSGIPILRALPTKSNREVWRLEKEVRALILKEVKEEKEQTSKDLLEIILKGAKDSETSQAEMDRFVVDNCKNIYLAGYETTSVTATWTMMLLGSNPEWQDRVRTEVLEVCGGQMPDADMVRKMKTLTMVIHESLRLYPPVCVISREALQDMKFGDIFVPKGVNVWTLIVNLHQDPELWGSDADKFNPERFAGGVSGACKHPHVYMPFGVGPRTCLGQHFAMAELKILIATIVSNFSFTISPRYIHAPALRLVIEPEHGVNLLIKKL